MELDKNQNSAVIADTEKPVITVPDIEQLPCRPILQTLVSRDTWVRVQFFRDKPVEKAEIFRTIELLCMMHNGWS